MKKIFSIMLLAISSVCVFTACDDDDVEYISEHENALPVISHETSFNAAAGQGNIVLEAAGPLTVTKDNGNWVTTAVEGNTVTVSVEANSSLEGRSAMLKISDGSRSTNFAIIQPGCVMDLGGVNYISRSNTKATLSYPYKENCNAVFSSDADWIHVSTEEGVLGVEIEANTSGFVRRGNVIWTAGELKGYIPVQQGSFNEIAGDYLLYYTDDNDKKNYYTEVTIKKSGTKYYFDMFDRSYPVLYDDVNKGMVWQAAQYVGDYTYNDKTTYIVTMVYDNTTGYLTWGKYGLIGKATQSTVDGNETVVMDFVDDGTWGSYKANSFMTELFSSKTSFTSSTRLGVSYGSTMVNPRMVKVLATSNAPVNAEMATAPKVAGSHAPAI